MLLQRGYLHQESAALNNSGNFNCIEIILNASKVESAVVDVYVFTLTFD